MADVFDLEKYLTKGVESIVRGALKASLSNPRESIFMAKFASASREASRKRSLAEENGEHIPPFLITSITSSCNLHCKGCYSRSNHACVDSTPINQLTDMEWLKIFKEADEMGISFILLAGGEPLIRKDIVVAAGKVPSILYPIFTNGTLFNDEYIAIFKRYRNLIPVLSIEGGEEVTDDRRGVGVYMRLIMVMDTMKRNQIIYGTSVTVTTANLMEVTSDEFLEQLSELDCKAVFYVEYVPVSEESTELAPGEKEREYINQRLNTIREKYRNMLFISFPGDEKSSGGCLAAGRGFLHINSYGGAEPCPFSPYSDTNVRDTSLREALHSKFFKRLIGNSILMEEHAGGCILYERKAEVEKLL